MTMLQEVFFSMPAAGIALAAFAGAWAGSFLNVVAHRLPRMIQPELLEAGAPKEAEPYNLAWPGSHCPTCHAPVRMRHNIPIISWIWLHGRCVDCHAPIALRYPLLELGGAASCGLAIANFGLTATGVAAAGLLCGLLVLAVLDLEHWLLPDAVVLPLIWAGLLVNTGGLLVEIESAVWGAAVGYGALRLLAAVWGRIRKLEVLGRGDCKLAAALGAWLGWPGLAATLMLAGLGTALVGLATRRKAEEPLPFGPGLAAAGTLVLFIQPDNLLSLGVYL